MQILVISDDTNLIKMANYSENIIGMQPALYNQSSISLNIFAFVYKNNPSLLIIDDDYLTPNIIQLIDTIQKEQNKLSIAFMTSNSSKELVKTISQLGIYFNAKEVI